MSTSTRTRLTGRRKNNERDTPRTDQWVERLARMVDGHGLRADLARYIANGNEQKVAGARSTISKVLDQNGRPSLEFALAADEWMQASYGGVDGAGTERRLKIANERENK